jgi:S-adenosylmethionine-diacylglycerol 3-amino-3-carboxypropyl transferase
VSWVDDAARLPLAFAQVREDPRVDLDLVKAAGAGARVMMIASGGDTACALAALGGVSRLHLVDPNPAQLALTRLKLSLLKSAGPERRLELLGHRELPNRGEAIAARLRELSLAGDALGPPSLIAEKGPDHAGRYEVLFAKLRGAIGELPILSLMDPYEQANAWAGVEPLLDRAYAQVLALPILVALFGEGATRNPVQPFDRHFLARTKWALETIPARANPWLQQMLAGRFAGVAYDWLEAPIALSLPEVTWEIAMMEPAMRAARSTFDVVHLSNILDWLSPRDAASTLEAARAVLKDGGLVVIRQLNSTLDVRAAGVEWFDWDSEWSDRLHATDRSFFYRALHIGRARVRK